MLARPPLAPATLPRDDHRPHSCETGPTWSREALLSACDREPLTLPIPSQPHCKNPLHPRLCRASPIDPNCLLSHHGADPCGPQQLPQPKLSTKS